MSTEVAGTALEMVSDEGLRRLQLRLLRMAAEEAAVAWAAQVLAEEAAASGGERAREAALTALADALLLAAGYPVAFFVGDEMPDVPELVEEAKVVDIRVGELRKYIKAMPPLRRRVLRRYWGIGYSRPHNQSEVAEHVGVSQARVSQLLSSAMADLRVRFGVADEGAHPVASPSQAAA